MPSTLKGLVSKKKIRYQLDGFDLDLTYITHRVIAMGYPAQSWEGIYRNHIDDVVNFFKKKHEGHYQIYNLCNERHIDEQKFGPDIINHSFPFNDHNPPRFYQMINCTDHIQNYLDQHSENIVAIQCKAGKGRTGVIVCSSLLKQDFKTNATEALLFYGKARTTNGKGVTIPSQIRYIYYYDHFLHNNLKYKDIFLKLNYLVLEELPNMASNGYEIQVIVYGYDKKGKLCEYYSSQYFEVKRDIQRSLKLDPEKEWIVSGDLKFQIVLKSKFGKKENLCHCWLNTFFVVHKPPIMFLADKGPLTKFDAHCSGSKKANKLYPDNQDAARQNSLNIQSDRMSPTNCKKSYKFTLQKQEIDKANKDVNNKTFPQNFAITFLFEHSSAPRTIPKSKSRKGSNIPSLNELCPQPITLKGSINDKDFLDNGTSLGPYSGTSSREDNSDIECQRSESSESSAEQSPNDQEETID